MLLGMLKVEIIIIFEDLDVLNKLAHLHICFLQIIHDHKMRDSFSFVGNKIPEMNNTTRMTVRTSLVEESVLCHNLSMHISKSVMNFGAFAGYHVVSLI